MRYFVIASYETIEDLNLELKKNSQSLNDVLNLTDDMGMTMLENCLANRNFLFANYLLDNGAKVNVVSDMGYNEYHYIASNMRIEGALEICCRLLDLGVDLNQEDKISGNTALINICHNILLTSEKKYEDFLLKCLNQVNDLKKENKYGMSVYKMLEQRRPSLLEKINNK